MHGLQFAVCEVGAAMQAGNATVHPKMTDDIPKRKQKRQKLDTRYDMIRTTLASCIILYFITIIL